MMAATTLTVEETNHLRAVYLCYRVAPEAMQTYFDKQHPPAILVSDLTTQKSNLQKIKGNILKQHQWDQLYPPTGTSIPASADFDITLLICLLRNMKPTLPQPQFGFDSLPHSSHITDGAHVARIKYYRNRLAHSTDGMLSNTDFANLWRDLEVAIIGIGGRQFGKKVNEAKSTNLDNSLVEILRRMTVYDTQYAEFSDEIKELKSELDVMEQDNKQRFADVTKRIEELEDKLKNKSNDMTNLFLQLEQQCTTIDKHSSEIRELQKALAAKEMENIPENRKELIQRRLEKWKEDETMFIHTRAADEVYSKLKDNSCLTVTGNSGMGKTMTTRHVALKMLEEGYIVVPISHPDEIVTLFSTKKKTLFVVDDLCGRYTLNKVYLDRLKFKLEDIQFILEKQNCKIVATCRLQVFKDEQFRTLAIFNECECNFNSNNLHLTAEETTTFATTYFGKHADEAISLSTEYDCFPFLCCLYHKNRNFDFKLFCKNPFQSFGEELDNLFRDGDDGKYKYCVLVLCVIYNNNFTERCFTGTIEMNTRTIIEAVLEECELSRGSSPKCLYRALQTLVGTFLIKDENCYKMIHDKLFDFVSFHLGHKMINILIQHADSGFIKERFLWNTENNKEKNVEYTISITNDVVDRYIARMIKDWTNKKEVDFFSNRNLKSSEFKSKVLYQFSMHNKVCQVQPGTADDGNIQHSSVTQISHMRNVKLTQWILEHELDVTRCGFDGFSSLYIACKAGNVQIVRDLLRHRADVNMFDKDGRSLLHTACLNGHTNVVTELLNIDKLKIDSCDGGGCSSLYLACQEGYVQIARDLQQQDADINKRAHNGWSPLHIACYNRHHDVIVDLLSNDNVKIDSCDNNGRSPLYLACRRGCLQVVGKLLLYGADINKCTQNGWSPLHAACYNDHIDVVIELLKNNDVKIDLCDKQGCSSLYLACNKGYVQIVSCLIKHGADINKCIKIGSSPLHTACYNGHKDVVTELLKNTELQVDLCNKNGCSPLHLACHKGYVQIVRDLIQHGADINKCRHDGKTPYRIALSNSHTAIISFLCDLMNSEESKCKQDEHSKKKCNIL